MWPLKLCEVTSSAVSRMEAKANSFIRKWLSLPRCFSTAGLYGWNSLQLPLKSITLGYRQEKARLVMELRDSSDRAVADVNARVETGRKWRAKEEVQKMERLQHKQIVGMVQAGRPRMERVTHPMVQGKQEGEEGPCCCRGHQDWAGGAQSEVCGTGAAENLGGCREPSNQLGRVLETATGSAQFPH